MRLRKIVVETVTVVKFRVDNKGSDGTGCFRIKVRTDKKNKTYTARNYSMRYNIHVYRNI